MKPDPEAWDEYCPQWDLERTPRPHVCESPRSPPLPCLTTHRPFIRFRCITRPSASNSHCRRRGTRAVNNKDDAEAQEVAKLKHEEHNPTTSALVPQVETRHFNISPITNT